MSLASHIIVARTNLRARRLPRAIPSSNNHTTRFAYDHGITVIV